MEFYKTARLTNSISSNAYFSFNRWGGVTYDDILSNYPKELIDKCWWTLSRAIIENYQMGKGTNIKGFGTFTFTNVEYSLEGTTNQYERDIKIRRPVFLVSNEFVDYLKPGQYNPKSGLIYYTQKKNNSIPIVKFNNAICSYGANISKEEYVTITSSIIKNMGDQIRRGCFFEKIMPNLGVLLIRGNVFGMKFTNECFERNKLKPERMLHLKKNLNLAMETSKSIQMRQRDINDIDAAERFVRPNTAVLTHISQSGDHWLNKNFNIDVKKLPEETREDILVPKPLPKKEYLVDQRYYRSYPKQNLGGLKISQEILEGIIKKKFLILREMKNYDRHGNSLITKFDFINSMKKANPHFRLGAELIEKIVNLYTGTDPAVNTVNYVSLMNAIESDIRALVATEYRYFPIEKYKGTINEDNKRACSAFAFCRNSGNLTGHALSSRRNYSRFFNPNEDDVKDDINKIKLILNYISKRKSSMISYLELISILEGFNLSFSKIQMMTILKFLGFENPNCFSINDFCMRIKRANFIKANYDVTLPQIKAGLKDLAEAIQKLGGEDYFFKEKEAIGYDEFNERIAGQTNLTKKVIDAIYDYITEKRKTPVTKAIFKKHLFLEKYYNPYDANFDISAIKEIVSKILSMELKSNSYFDHLLDYNICRAENEIKLNEFERLMNLEKFNYNKNEIRAIFNYIDFKKDGAIDRDEWNKTMTRVPHPIVSMQNYIRNKKLDIETLAYKMDIDLFDKVNFNSIMNQHIEKWAFKNKIKQINESFENDFIFSLFEAIVGPKREYITPNEIFKHFNIYKYESYKDIDTDTIINKVKKGIQSAIKFKVLIEELQKADKFITGRLTLSKFTELILNLSNNKVNKFDLLRVARIFKKINYHDEVFYHELAVILYDNVKEDNFQKCIQFLKESLEKDCNNDLFLFFVKMNNLSNTSGMDKKLSMARLYEYFRPHVELLHPSTMEMFDLNKDGVIDLEDMTGIVKTYIDKNFFLKKKQDKN